MGSNTQFWERACNWCTRRIDPLDTDNDEVGHFCGLCRVNYAQAISWSRLRKLAPTPFLPPEVFQVVAECLGGNRSSFRRAMKRFLLRLLLEGKPYGYRPCTLMLRRVLPRHSTTDDALDIVLDYVFGVRCGWPEIVLS